MSAGDAVITTPDEMHFRSVPARAPRRKNFSTGLFIVPLLCCAGGRGTW